MGDSDIFAAERIINKRTVNGVTQYYIKWKGYSNRDNTWEPAEHILDRSLLTAFEKKEAKKCKRGPSNNSKAANSSPPAKTTPNILEANSCDSLHRPSPSVINSPQQFQIRQPIFDDSNNNTVSSSPRVTNKLTQPLVTDLPCVTQEQQTSPISKPAAFQKPKRIDLISGGVSKIGESSSNSVASGSKSVTGVSSSSDLASQDLGSSLSSSASPTECNPIINFNTSQSATTATITSTPANSNKGKRTSSKFAILNTVITDVTVNDQTITISESKTNQGFFREVGRHSVAVDTTSSGDCVNMVD